MLRLNQLMQQLPREIDCGVIMSPTNRQYFTGFSSSAGMLVVTKEQAYLIIDFRYYEKAAREIQGCQVVLLEDYNKQLEEILKKHQCKTIAVEIERVTLAEYLRLKDYFTDYAFDTTSTFSDLINQLRMVKTPDEIYEILAAQEITEKAFDHILNFIKPGVTEKQVAFELDQYMRSHGADDISFETIAVSGKNSSSPHGTPTEKPLESGDFLTMDFGAMVHGYHSDMTRTVVIGKPTEEMEHLYQTVLEGQKMGLEAVCAGKKGQEVDNVVREYFDQQGYQGAFGHSLGHGVGMEIHEQPNLSPRSQTILQKGMVVTVEPGLYLPGKFGVRIEDMVVVTENGCRNLTNCKKELICL